VNGPPLANGSAIRGQLHTSDATDTELLNRFIRDKDEAAFAQLMRRHGPMVLGVCRRLLRHAQDAEDAFQATFLLLVRKAARIGKAELLGSWLYGVALRVAIRSRLQAARRQQKERTDTERRAAAQRSQPRRAQSWRDGERFFVKLVFREEAGLIGVLRVFCRRVAAGAG
jgi:DNA-directed RNA polymerase specialized sigma24 family protein